MTMDALLQELKSRFFSLLVGHATVSEFETWVYQTPQLEGLFTPCGYRALLELDYSATSAVDDVLALLLGSVFYAEWHVIKLTNRLTSKLTLESITSHDLLNAIVDLEQQGYHLFKELADRGGGDIIERRIINLEYTYFIPNSQRLGSLYFEFQPGTFVRGFWLKHSLYLSACGGDSGCDIEDYGDTVMGIYSKFLDSFDYFGVTLINNEEGSKFVGHLRRFNELLKDGKPVLDVLKEMGCVPNLMGFEESFGENILDIDVQRLKNTTTVLADWVEEKLKTSGAISILGI